MATRNRTRRKLKRKQRQSLQPSGLVQEARRLLDKRDFRGALSQLKQLPAGRANPEGTTFLRFCILKMRARELDRERQAKSAEILRQQAAEFYPEIDPYELNQIDLELFLECCSIKNAVEVYANSLTNWQGSSGIERDLADRIVIQKSWESIEPLSKDHPLRSDIDPIIDGMDAMDNGEWGEAANFMQKLPRRSPYAPWRVFCRAMQAFRDENDEHLRKALDLLPLDFILSGTISELHRVAAGTENTTTSDSAAVLRVLGLDSLNIASLGNEFRAAISCQSTVNEVSQSIKKFAKKLCPDDPIPAVVDLVMISELAVLSSAVTYKAPELISNLVPKHRIPGVWARCNLGAHLMTPYLWNAVATRLFFDNIAAEFPDPNDQRIAKSVVCEVLASSELPYSFSYRMDDDDEQALESILGQDHIDYSTVRYDLMELSVKLDPDNLDGHRKLLSMYKNHRWTRERKRAALNRMTSQFPEEAEPWRQLAEMDYARNAYRQAEKSLAEALKRAPHDDQMLDMQATGFLIAADRNRRSGKYKLAAADIERAEKMNRPQLELAVKNKRLLLDFVSSKGDLDQLMNSLQDFEPAELIRQVAVLIQNVKDEVNNGAKNVNQEMAIELYRACLGLEEVFEQVEPAMLGNLIAPIPSHLVAIYPTQEIATVLTSWWQFIMRNSTFDSLLDAFDHLMVIEQEEVVRIEIKRRLSEKIGSSDKNVLLLYLAVIRYLFRQDHDGKRIKEVFDNASRTESLRLKSCAGRLGKVTTGGLRAALMSLRFDNL